MEIGTVFKWGPGPLAPKISDHPRPLTKIFFLLFLIWWCPCQRSKIRNSALPLLYIMFDFTSYLIHVCKNKSKWLQNLIWKIEIISFTLEAMFIIHYKALFHWDWLNIQDYKSVKHFQTNKTKLNVHGILVFKHKFLHNLTWFYRSQHLWGWRNWQFAEIFYMTKIDTQWPEIFLNHFFHYFFPQNLKFKIYILANQS